MSDNELIAEFMGIGTDKIMPISALRMYDHPVYGETNYTGLHYQTSWDWLMPVVEKIAKIETKDTVRNGEDSYFDSYFPRTFGMINSETKEFMVRINRNPLHQSDSLIKATHEAVVEFIKWYNQNK